MKLGWLTDPHLNSAREPALHALAGQLSQQAPDALLVTGDLHEAPGITRALRWLSDAAGCPIYFVLGNHDFYRGSIPAVRAACASVEGLTYMTERAFVSLTPTTALVGHDGWGDARAGDALRSPVLLNDFLLIDELRGLDRTGLIKKLGELGDEAAAHVEPALDAALEAHEHAIFITHVPPFVEAAWHEGKHSDADWAPYFVCQAVGEALLRVAARWPQRRVTALCGHTHGAGEAWLRPNLHVRTGGARYGAPALQAPLWIV